MYSSPRHQEASGTAWDSESRAGIDWQGSNTEWKTLEFRAKQSSPSCILTGSGKVL